ncbi:dTMP kinase [Dehalogenimonas formicexedens]|uniref:Thymidylate kinase n=1 Tax=Dehalogenimonas formicexedens TaxID=1839801 RepID=A0A1P8F759_9CHLR|nr:dTMP kinase [Dehalogenimonas formicexedens]APV44326.1 dTMP kinase [Dehalogenimonas formicexedens]
MSLFVTFEGGEGSGKSTQAGILAERLATAGLKAVLTHEPGGTGLGEKITQLLKWSEDEHISPLAEVMLFNASRAELVSRIIKPALASGKVVVCDRYVDSTLVYQGYGRGLTVSTVKAINSMAAQGLMPEITFFLDLPVDEGARRKFGTKADRFERESTDFHRRVRDGYRALAATEPSRCVVIDALLPKDEIANIIWNKTLAALELRASMMP